MVLRLTLFCEVERDALFFFLGNNCFFEDHQWFWLEISPRDPGGIMMSIQGFKN